MLINCLWPFSLAITSTGRVGFVVLCPGAPEGSPAVVLLLMNIFLIIS